MNIMQYNFFINKIYMLVLFTLYNYKVYIYENDMNERIRHCYCFYDTYEYSGTCDCCNN